MRHGRLIAWIALGCAALTAQPAAALQRAPAEGRDITVRRMVLAETRIAPGAQQLMQVTVANTGLHPVPASLHADLRDSRDRRLGPLQTRTVTLASKDDQRFLFKFRAPEEPGNYSIRFEVRTGDGKLPLIPGGPVYFSPFVVGQGRRAPPPSTTMQQARVKVPNYVAPQGLSFEKPDLVWENFTVAPASLLVGESLHIRADLRNEGGDIARDIHVQVVYFNVRTPNRSTPISENTVRVLAPGEKLEMEFEAVLPDDALLGEYRVKLIADSIDSVDESDETNNEVTSNPIRLTRIKLIFPEPGFAFEEQGLFLFRWDSLRYDEFKVQVGTDPHFSDPGTYFDLPQGDKWTREKEIVPLEGELPAMATGLTERSGSRKLYWRVLARDSKSGRDTTSVVYPFTIKPSPKPKEVRPPGAMAPAAPPPAQPAAKPPAGEPSAGQPEQPAQSPPASQPEQPANPPAQ